MKRSVLPPHIADVSAATQSEYEEKSTTCKKNTSESVGTVQMHVILCIALSQVSIPL